MTKEYDLKPITVRLSRVTLDDLAKAATSQKRKRGDYARLLIEEALEARKQKQEAVK